MSIMQNLFSIQLKNFTFVGFSTSATNTITIPAISREGDFAVLFDSSDDNDLFNPTSVVPSGWTSIRNDFGVDAVLAGESMRSIVSYKLLVSGDPGSSITGMNTNLQTTKIILVFRPNFVIQTASILSISGDVGAPNPDSQEITITEGLTPILAFAHWATYLSNNVTTRGVSGITMTEVSNGTTQYAGYKIFNTNETTSNATVSISAPGNVKSLQSFYVAFT